jgi:predicted DNA-binding transcriptional regulator AlpA
LIINGRDTTSQEIGEMIRSNNSKKSTRDIRIAFKDMSDDALISKSELAQLLCLSEGTIGQLLYRGELPPKAKIFSSSRRVHWFVRDIRPLLQRQSQESTAAHIGEAAKEETRRTGRPRKATDFSTVFGS